MPTMQPRPPETTEICGVESAATKPASALPRRGPLVTTACWIEESRPRRRSGASVWMMVERKTAEMTSAAPATASRPRARGRNGERPKPVRATPQMTMATADRVARSTDAFGPTREREAMSAPNPGAE